ncbi:hypothetical protein [Streptomyces sp. NBC_01727]|uniref:hypothetical protein n=1 Tax=unclassified Streptomyces TaxID=2593676 RepID=UPI002E10EBD6|nr:hypothetical protein OIE76_39690 [Streptomyces sp. NBC_01727]
MLVAKEHVIGSFGIVNASGIDYGGVFQALPNAVALFTTDLVYADVTEAATMALTAGRRPPRWKPTRPRPGPAA